MSITVFYSSVSSSQEMNKTQQRIFNVLDSKKIKYATVDISMDFEGKDSMRELARNPTALPPQICNGNQYCGIKKTQQRIIIILSSKKIKYEMVDISQDIEAKQLMRELAENERALPPQVCNGNQYCGDYKAFDNAIEEDTLESFLKI